jgi:peptidoglycan hydrolase CwlO-like protein
MDEKETYVKDNEASRAELNEAISELKYATADLADKLGWSTLGEPTSVKNAQTRLDAAEVAIQSKLDILYARLYLAECPF